MKITFDDKLTLLKMVPRYTRDEMGEGTKIGKANPENFFGPIADFSQNWKQFGPHEEDGQVMPNREMKNGAWYVGLRVKTSAGVTKEEMYEFCNKMVNTLLPGKGDLRMDDDFIYYGTNYKSAGDHTKDEKENYKDIGFDFKDDETKLDFYLIEFYVSGKPTKKRRSFWESLVNENKEDDIPEDEDYYECNFPTWALNYWVNGEKGDLKDYEIKLVDKFYDEIADAGYDPNLCDLGDDGYFSSRPEFGDAGDCVDAKFYKNKMIKEDHDEKVGPWISENGEMTRKIPQAAIDDCTRPGVDATDSCRMWVDRLGFDKDFPFKVAKGYIKESGYSENVNEMTENDIVIVTFWMICGMFKDDPDLNGCYSIDSWYKDEFDEDVEEKNVPKDKEPEDERTEKNNLDEIPEWKTKEEEERELRMALRRDFDSMREGDPDVIDDGSERMVVSEKVQELSQCKDWKQAEKFLYNQVEPLVRGFKKDNDWSHVRMVFDKMKELGANVNYYASSRNNARNGYYFDPDGYSDKPKGKMYDFEIDFDNSEGKNVKLNGQLICSFAGKSDEFIPDRYDMIIQFWNGNNI